MRVLAAYGMRAPSPHTLPQTGIGFFLFDDIAIAVGAIAGAIAACAGAVGLGSIITAGVCTALATTFITSAVAALSKLMADLVSAGVNEIKKAIDQGAKAIYAKVDEEIAKVKPEWDKATRDRVAEPFVHNVRQTTSYLAGAIGRQPGWSEALPNWLVPGAVDKLNRFQAQIVTAVLLKDPTQAGFAYLATMFLAPYARSGDESAFSASWMKIMGDWKKAGGGALPFDSSGSDPTIAFAPAAPPLTPEENIMKIAADLTAQGVPLVADTGWADFSALDKIYEGMAAMGPDTSSWEVADWTIAPTLTRENRQTIALEAVKKFPAFGAGMMGMNAWIPYDRTAEFAGYLLDPSTPVRDVNSGITYPVKDSPYLFLIVDKSRAGALINATLRKIAQDVDAARAASAAQKVASVVKAPPPVISLSPTTGKVVVTKPKPTFASFVWGSIFSR